MHFLSLLQLDTIENGFHIYQVNFYFRNIYSITEIEKLKDESYIIQAVG